MGSVQSTIIITAVLLWFAIGTYINVQLRDVHKKLDAVLDEFNGLREYLYEIDPQFDDERESDARVSNAEFLSGYDDMKIKDRKRAGGRRTLNTPFVGPDPGY